MAWIHASKDGIATNKDEIFGGIVDVNVDGWFAIPQNDNIEMAEGFSSKSEAIEYISSKANAIGG